MALRLSSAGKMPPEHTEQSDLQRLSRGTGAIESDFGTLAHVTKSQDRIYTGAVKGNKWRFARGSLRIEISFCLLFSAVLSLILMHPCHCACTLLVRCVHPANYGALSTHASSEEGLNIGRNNHRSFRARINAHLLQRLFAHMTWP
jgi:hypothetical protein